MIHKNRFFLDKFIYERETIHEKNILHIFSNQFNLIH